MALPVLIVGGGIGGLAAARALERAGIDAKVFEQASVLREVGAGVSLWPNAMAALRELSLFQAVLDGHRPLERILVRRLGGRVLMRLEGMATLGDPAICVHRAHLQQTLASSLPEDRVRLGSRVEEVVADEAGVAVRLQDGSWARGRLLIGCDGIHSTVRTSLHGRSKLRYRGYRIWRGVADLSIPGPLLGQATEWWAPGHRFGLLPGEPGRVYWYATRSDSIRDPRREGPGLENSFRSWPPPIPEILEYSGDAVVHTEAADRPVAWGRGPVTLLGDASHPMTPNMGQGACTALEDAVVLARSMEALGPTPEALREYERRREVRAGWIVRQSRRIGCVAQLSHPLAVAGRDLIMRALPGALADRVQRRVHAISFNGRGSAR